MPKKKEATPWESVDKKGMVLTGYCKSDNLIMREICNAIGPYAYVVYMALLSHKNTNDNFSFPSQPVIAKETGISIRQVRYLLDELCAHNFISINSGNSKVSSRYYFPKESFYDAGEDTWKRRTRPAIAKTDEAKEAKVDISEEDEEIDENFEY